MRRFINTLTILLSVTFYCQAQMDYSPGFKAGKPSEMNIFNNLEGEFEVQLFYTADRFSEEPNWLPWAETKSIFTSELGGIFVREDAQGFPINPVHDGFNNWEYIGMYSYDRFNEIYRITFYDNILGLADIYEGQYENERLIASNINTATYNNHGEGNSPQKNSIIISDISKNQFTLIWRTVDENKIIEDNIPWAWSVKMVYKKKN